MGRIILHNWEVETKLNIVLNISSTRFQINGSAIVSYRSDDFSEDTDSMITFSNRDPFTVMMDVKTLLIGMMGRKVKLWQYWKTL